MMGWLSTAGRELRPMFSGPRLLLAFKTALAAGLSWWLAHLLPAEVDQYSYYAPLGAVISMSGTLMGSVRQGMQTLAGIGIGILLAWAVVGVDGPGYITIPIVVGVAILFGGIRRLGSGGDYVTVAALFVLVIGGANPETYSFAYLTQMGVGVAVGFAVNLAIAPPLTVGSAVLKISGFRLILSKQLNDIGTALVENWPPEDEEWAETTGRLASTASEVRQALLDAAESKRANPRALLHKRDINSDYLDLEALENIGFHIRDISETLASAMWGQPFTVSVPAELVEPASHALCATADFLRAWDAGEAVVDRRAQAEDALEQLFARLNHYHAEHRDLVTGVASVAFDVHRILYRITSRLSEAHAPEM